MQETLFDSIGDFGLGNASKPNIRIAGAIIPDPANVGSLSLPKQTKVFLSRLDSALEAKETNVFDYAELIAIGRSINMNVGDFFVYLEKLNDQGYLLKAGPKQWKYSSSKL